MAILHLVATVQHPHLFCMMPKRTRLKRPFGSSRAPPGDKSYTLIAVTEPLNDYAYDNIAYDTDRQNRAILNAVLWNPLSASCENMGINILQDPVLLP